jgi:hypothetical protein
VKSPETETELFKVVTPVPGFAFSDALTSPGSIRPDCGRAIARLEDPPPAGAPIWAYRPLEAANSMQIARFIEYIHDRTRLRTFVYIMKTDVSRTGAEQAPTKNGSN